MHTDKIKLINKKALERFLNKRARFPGKSKCQLNPGKTDRADEIAFQ